MKLSGRSSLHRAITERRWNLQAEGMTQGKKKIHNEPM